jgi:NADH-quinone oxidoreductase subunit M
MNPLTLAIILPALVALPLGFLHRARPVVLLGLLTAAIDFALCLRLVGGQWSHRVAWLPTINLDYVVSADSVTVLMLLLNSFMTLLCAAWLAVARPAGARLQMLALLALESAAAAAFCSDNLLLFYVFFEASLAPVYVLIITQGSRDRLRAAVKYLLYTIAGSVLFLGAIAMLWYQHGRATGRWTLEFPALLSGISTEGAFLAFCGLFIAFAIKTPMLPFHTWLPDAHTQAPVVGSVMLAAVLLKLGSWGFYRYCLPMLPLLPEMEVVRGFIVAGSVAAILYGAWVCLGQQDWKRLIAYSSVSHLGFVTLGIFSRDVAGLQGALLQQFSHGVSAAMLFLLAGMVYERSHSLHIADFGGLIHRMPRFGFFFSFALFSSAGLPLLCGFTGEVLILSGALRYSVLTGLAASAGLVLGAAYLLRLFQLTMLGEARETHATFADLHPGEIAVLLPLSAASLFIGIYPAPFFALLQGVVAR